MLRCPHRAHGVQVSFILRMYPTCILRHGVINTCGHREHKYPSFSFAFLFPLQPSPEALSPSSSYSYLWRTCEYKACRISVLNCILSSRTCAYWPASMSMDARDSSSLQAIDTFIYLQSDQKFFRILILYSLISIFIFHFSFLTS